MNDHDRPIPRTDTPSKLPPKLQALDLATLRGVAGAPGALDALVCDIDDPDCEAPAFAPPPVEDRRRTEVIDDLPSDN